MAECDQKGVPGKEAGFSQKPQPVSSPVLPVQYLYIQYQAAPSGFKRKMDLFYMRNLLNGKYLYSSFIPHPSSFILKKITSPMSNTELDILVVAPHPDDAELGMGGAILKLKSEGFRLGILDLTSGEPTPFGTPETRTRETQAATEILGVDWRENLGLTNRSLEPTLSARAKLAGVFRQVRPRWIFAPYWVDAHPDHVAATELIEAARFWAKLTKTDLPGEPYYPPRIFYY
jgi:hypothetical protein